MTFPFPTFQSPRREACGEPRAMPPIQSLYSSPDDELASQRLAQEGSVDYHLAETWVNARDGSLMRLIPAGEFIMGSTPAEIEAARKMDFGRETFALEHEMPQVRLRVPAFYLGVYAITNAQFARFLTETRPRPEHLARWLSRFGHTPLAQGPERVYRAEAGYERHPVAQVSWVGAEAYCQWAGLRLPKEIEWEKAARGTDGRLFPWGDAWYDDHLQWQITPGPERVPTAPVDACEQGRSPYGLFQMAGNVDEWCADAYQADAYRQYATGDLHPPAQGPSRVVRGGMCLGRHHWEFRCAMRRAQAPDRVARRYTGLRCASGELVWTRQAPLTGAVS